MHTRLSGPARHGCVLIPLCKGTQRTQVHYFMQAFQQLTDTFITSCKIDSPHRIRCQCLLTFFPALQGRGLQVRRTLRHLSIIIYTVPYSLSGPANHFLIALGLPFSLTCYPASLPFIIRQTKYFSSICIRRYSSLTPIFPSQLSF